MANFGEKVEADLKKANDKDDDEKCPFCKKEKLGHKKGQPKKVDTKVVSTPSDLNCKDTSTPSKKFFRINNSQTICYG